MRDLGSLDGFYSQAHAVNDAGQIVGSFSPSRAFLWENGSMHDLGTPPGAIASTANDINEEGVIVGRSGTSHDDHAFVYENGVMRDLGAFALLTDTDAARFPPEKLAVARHRIAEGRRRHNVRRRRQG